MHHLINEGIALLLVIVLGSLASGAGVAGGALFIPMFVLLLSPQSTAIPLSKACAFGASIALFIVHSQRIRLKPDGSTYPMIDYRLALLLEPFTLVGTLIGVRLNKLIPFEIIAVMMSLLLTMIMAKTFHRARALRRVEIEAENQQLLERSQSIPVLQSIDKSVEYDDDARSSFTKNDPQFPVMPILLLTIYWSFGILTAAILSGHVFGPINCLSPTYISVLISSMIVLIVAACTNAYLEIQSSTRSKQRTYDDRFGAWTSKNVFFLSCGSFLAGVCSALVGVGGSAIKGPLLAHFAPADVATSTAAFMLLSTCSASMFQFVLLDMLDYRQALVFFLAGFIAAYYGSRKWIELIQQWNRRSIIVFIMATYVAAATVAMTALSIYKLGHADSIMQPGSIC